LSSRPARAAATIWAGSKQCGGFVLVPGDITHDFENRGSERAGVLNFSAPGTFEEHMPAIVEWFTDNPPSEAIA
jgi:hypothetical protein